MDQSILLRELGPVAERLYDRHDAAAKEWFPHEMVPWGRGRDFAAGELWGTDEGPTPAGGGAQRFVRDPPPRGHPAVLLPHDRAHVRSGQHLGHLGAAVDGRRRPPL